MKYEIVTTAEFAAWLELQQPKVRNIVKVVVLNGGNKNGQNRDIKEAKKIKNEILEGIYSIRE